ncbi:beta-ketoacyl synthase N-terminal-like domain-containing protein [Nocardia wallacei]|uniref:beta-ketoacyl synthase N-terminal-like domain-containing protein n=1 Tax=Nocardia wallacei TaxID=480035 RepID=UPI00245633ED|nr:beta-ketoacyl synthase N-terminal-like domain-containing protein [Nocardia wallacei]
MTAPVIAGTGAVASVGADVAALYENLCAGRSGRAPLRRFTPESHISRHAYEIDDGPGRPSGDTGAWLCAAIAEATAAAGLTEADLTGIPVLVGTGLRALRRAEVWCTGGPALSAPDLHFGPILRERFGCTEVHTVNNACSAALYALGLGADLLAADAHDTVIVAGVDTITESMFGLLDRAGGRGVDRVQPFDADRRGVLLGEGAAAVVLRRHGPGRALLRSVALNCDAGHVTAPDGAGIRAAMRAALARAGIAPEEVGLVFAHGTGTQLNDRTEAEALTEIFGATAHSGPLVTAIKSMLGHTSGASGLHSLVVAVETLTHGVVPPILGLRTPAAEASALRLCAQATAAAGITVAQVDAFGFGGVNAVALIEAAAGTDAG